MPELPVLAILGRVDRRDGAPPAYRVELPCCGAEETYSAWAFSSAWLHQDGRFTVHCDACGRWTPTRLAHPWLQP
jgi:hypothetical protein